MKRDDPFHVKRRYEVARDDVMLSWLATESVMPGTPEYGSNKQFLEAHLYVVPDHRRQRIGSSWVRLLVALMDRDGATILNVGTSHEAGQGFLRWLGAEPKFSEVQSRLDLTALDWAMVERWAAEGPTRSGETRLEIYDGALPEEMWSEFAPQYTALINSMPFEGLEHGEIVLTPEQMREFTERQRVMGERQHTVLTREPDGSISGLTDVDWAPHRPGLVHQQLTAVRPDARGRGIGKWIKAAMLLHLRQIYPDLKWIGTENAGSNAPMLAINTKVGFKPYRRVTWYQISRDALEKAG
jgi:GNAT superfamily N-acetyltransferase